MYPFARLNIPQPAIVENQWHFYLKQILNLYDEENLRS
jgi:hypothetical protein